jgi:TPR repeat protein
MNIGRCHDLGFGVPQSQKEAFNWYKKASEAGHMESQYNLAVCYRNGRGVARDDKEAVRLYRLSAAKGFPQALSNLGSCYLKGNGVEENETEAFAYFTLAAETREVARTILASMTARLSASEIAAGRKRAKEIQQEIDANKGK